MLPVATDADPVRFEDGGNVRSKRFKPAFHIRLEIAHQRRFGDPSNAADSLVRKALAFQIQRIEFLTNVVMRMMKAGLIQRVDLCGRKVNSYHRYPAE